MIQRTAEPLLPTTAPSSKVIQEDSKLEVEESFQQSPQQISVIQKCPEGIYSRMLEEVSGRSLKQKNPISVN